MSTRRVGLHAVLHFSTGASLNKMNSSTRAFNRVRTSAVSAQKSFSQFASGAVGLATIGAVTVGVAKKMTSSLIKFEEAMGGVQAKLDQREGEFQFLPRIEAAVKQLGLQTQFTAAQAAQGFEALRTAGVKAADILDKDMLRSVLNLSSAAGKGFGLSKAADLTARSLNIFQEEGKSAAQVADIFAYVAKNTASTIPLLNNGLSKFGSIAATAGINMNQTITALGVMHDINLSGTRSGTALTNFVNKMLKAMKNGKITVGSFSNVIHKNSRGGLDLAQTMFNIGASLKSITNKKDRLSKTKEALELFGIRGSQAAAAMEILTKNPEKLQKLFGKGLEKRIMGVADSMGNARLDTLAGDFIKLQSAWEGFNLAITGLFKAGFRTSAQQLTSTIQQLGTAFNYLGNQGKTVPKELSDAYAKVNPAIKQVSMGIKEGIDSAISITKSGVGVIRSALGGAGSFLPVTLKDMTKLGTTAIGLTVPFGAIALTAGVAGYAVKSFANTAIGGFRLMHAGMKPVLSGMRFMAQSVRGLPSFTSAGKMSTAIKGLQGGSQLSKLGGFLGKGLGKLGLAGRAVEQFTAQPVRVVNFHEAAMMNGVAGAGGAGGLGGLGGKGKVGGLLKKFAGGAAVVGLGIGVGMMAREIPLVRKAGDAVGNALGDAIGGLFNRATMAMADAKAASRGSVNKAGLAAAKMRIASILDLRQTGKQSVLLRGDKQRTRIDQDLLEMVARRTLKGRGVKDDDIATTMIELKKMIELELPIAIGLGMSKANVNVNLDGRKVNSNLDDSKRLNNSRGVPGKSNILNASKGIGIK